MCEYCENNKTMINKEILSDWILSWPDTAITNINADYICYIIFLDRGFLRFADKDDCNCMDHGHKIKIYYCPFCGTELKGEHLNEM